MVNRVRELLQAEREHDANLRGIVTNDDGTDPYATTTLPPFAWPGGYTIEYITREGSILCAECATKAIDDPDENDPPIDYGAYDEGPAMQCDGCGYWLLSSYGDPDLSDSENDEMRTSYEAENRQLRADKV